MSDYKFSKFNYVINSGKDETVIFNTYSNALISVPNKEFEEIMKGVGTVEAYVKMGILVPYYKNELEDLYINRAKKILANAEPTYRIFTTTACNARCWYCYENCINKKYMTIETANRSCDFILGNSEGNKCFVQFFGGEPLMNPQVIDLVCDRLKDNARFEMISNASLVDKVGMDRIKKWKIEKIQITLDGTNDVYNKIKNYIDLPNAFEHVVNNIAELIANGVVVTIRLNYNHNNVPDILNLIHFLADRFPQREYLRVYAAHLFSKEDTESIETKKEDWFAIQDTLIETGFSTTKKAFSFSYKTSQCFACHTRSFAITPDGKLYKCALSINNEEEQLGDVYSGITNYERLMSWANPAIREECRDCVWLPVCQCGCEAGRKGYVSNKCFFAKEFADAVLKKRIEGIK